MKQIMREYLKNIFVTPECFYRGSIFMDSRQKRSCPSGTRAGITKMNLEYLVFANALSKIRNGAHCSFRITAFLFIGLFAFGSSASAQSIRSLVNNGNEMFEKKQYSDAEAEYKKALEKEKDLMEGTYNLGNAVQKQQRFDEAIQNYQQALTKTADKSVQSKIHYNIGNSYFEGKQYKESIDSYKRALKLDPSDEDAKYNLAYASRMLKEQQKQQQQQKNDKNKKQDKKEEKKQDQQQQQQQQKQDQQQQQQQQQQKEMSKKEAERILEALKNDEKNTQKKVRKKAPVRMNVEKDW